MAYPTNILQQVQTYQRSGLALLLNSYAFISKANKKFENFNDTVANLGSSITFDLPPRLSANAGLVATVQAANQRFQTLSVNQASNVTYSFSNEERIFNVDKSESYLPAFVETAIASLGAFIEADIAKNAISGVVAINPNSPSYGQPNVSSGPYRFFGNGRDQISSFQQISQMIANFKDYGAVREGIWVVLPEVNVPAIVGSGLNQFTPRRNDEMAMSWEIGAYGTPEVMYYQSNLLPIHTSGTVGNNATTLTLVSVNDPTGANVTQMTFSGAAASDPNAVVSGDLGQFNDGVSGQPTMRYLSFTAYSPTQQPVQFRVTANAASTSGGQVTVNITPALCWVAGATQNLNNPLAPGMQVSFVPTHRAGLVVGGNSLFLAMPRLPPQRPYDVSSEIDKDSGASIRLTYGSVLGQDKMLIIHDAIWDSTLVPEYSMRVLFPPN